MQLQPGVPRDATSEICISCAVRTHEWSAEHSLRYREVRGRRKLCHGNHRQDIRRSICVPFVIRPISIQKINHGFFEI